MVDQNSIEAMPSKKEKERRIDQVHAMIVALGFFGATTDELSETLGVPPHHVSPTMTFLKQRVMIVTDGRRRPTRYGKQAGVWVAA